MPRDTNEPVVTALDIRGKRYEVTCDTRGRFSTPTPTPPGFYSYGGYETLEALRLALMKATKRAAVRVRILVTRNRGDKLVNLTVTGRHQGNNKLLTKEHGAIDNYGDLYRRFTPEEVNEWNVLAKAYDDAKSAFERFREARKLDVGGLILAAEKAAELAADDAAELEQARDEGDAADGATSEPSSDS